MSTEQNKLNELTELGEMLKCPEYRRKIPLVEYLFIFLLQFSPPIIVFLYSNYSRGGNLEVNIHLFIFVISSIVSMFIGAFMVIMFLEHYPKQISFDKYTDKLEEIHTRLTYIQPENLLFDPITKESTPLRSRADMVALIDKIFEIERKNSFTETIANEAETEKTD